MNYYERNRRDITFMFPLLIFYFIICVIFKLPISWAAVAAGVHFLLPDVLEALNSGSSLIDLNPATEEDIEAANNKEPQLRHYVVVALIIIIITQLF